MVARLRKGDKAHSGPCEGCGYLVPPGSNTCLVCGRVERWRGEAYPAATIDRYAWIGAQHVGDFAAKAILRLLVDHDLPGSATPGTVYPGVARLAARAECSEATVYRALAHLEDQGWLVVQRASKRSGRRDRNRYTIRSRFAPTSQFATSQIEGSQPRKLQVEGVKTEGVKDSLPREDRSPSGEVGSRGIGS